MHSVKCSATNEQKIELNGVEYIIEFNNEMEKKPISPLSKDINNIIAEVG